MPLNLNADNFEVVADLGAAEPTAMVDRSVRSDDLASLDAGEGYLAAARFEGKLGSTALLPPASPESPNGSDAPAPLTLAVGLGDVALSTADLRTAAASVGRAGSKLESLGVGLAVEAASTDDAPGADAALSAVVEGLALASYTFHEHKGKQPDPSALARIAVAAPPDMDAAATEAAVARGLAVAQGIALARDLVNQPAGTLTASAMAQTATEAIEAAAAELPAEAGSTSVEVWDAARLAEERCGGMLGVNAGSTEPPALIRMRYSPAGEPRAAIHLVGKGITFDTGGLNLKSFEGMEWMKVDMGGAAAVIGAMSAIVRLAPDVAVVGTCCCTDNQPGPTATKPGDVLHIRNGKTVEVLNTDAEGRLVLADGLSLAAEESPDMVVDLATLTGACLVALGEGYAGLMGNKPEAIERTQAAAAAAGEKVWHLPLPTEYREQLDSPIADLRNIGKNRYGGTLIAGIFLSEFVGDTPWVHLDIAGPVRSDADEGEFAKGATGFGVRTLVELVCGW